MQHTLYTSERFSCDNLTPRRAEGPHVSIRATVTRSRAGAYLGKVSDKVAAVLVGLSHDIEEERVDVVQQRLVAQEHLGKQAQVLAVKLVVQTATRASSRA